MRDKVIRPERRQPERRPNRLAALGQAMDDASGAERRIHCWDLEPECSEARRKRCAAHFVQRNCWDLWATEYFPPGRKPCCHGDLDCSECAVAASKFKGPISVYVEIPSTPRGVEPATPPGRPRAYCPLLYRAKDGPPTRDDEEPRPTFRCRHRGGIVLHSSYVFEVCGCLEHRQCGFYDSE